MSAATKLYLTTFACSALLTIFACSIMNAHTAGMAEQRRIDKAVAAQKDDAEADYVWALGTANIRHSQRIIAQEGR